MLERKRSIDVTKHDAHEMEAVRHDAAFGR